jgi:hypothetical protein
VAIFLWSIFPERKNAMKRKVVYVAARNVVVGQSADVIPLNHPCTDMVTNGHWAHTSPVVKMDGEVFETANSIYHPAAKPPVEDKEERMVIVSDKEFWS